ncbi:MAG: protocatechuate 3,4-dioxygenase subunit alpha [Chloroflexi bacterium]|nr:protocatechuate 3,4-dioxygenase subunit alpha [Chloroflexota bacterium]
MSRQSPSQTVGPFFHPALIDVQAQNDLVTPQTQGERIIITGRVLDGDGVAVPDAMIEVWQADYQGIYPHPNDPRHTEADPHFRGFGRVDTWQTGDTFTLRTIRPGPVPWDDTIMQAPHINVRVFARGMLIHAVTRIYFAGEPANAADPVLSRIDSARRETLIAQQEDTGDLPTYRFDIHLQGDSETVFFNP